MKREENEIYNLGKYQSLKIKPEKKEKMGLVEKEWKKRTYNYVLYMFKDVQENMNIKRT